MGIMATSPMQCLLKVVSARRDSFWDTGARKARRQFSIASLGSRTVLEALVLNCGAQPRVLRPQQLATCQGFLRCSPDKSQPHTTYNPESPPNTIGSPCFGSIVHVLATLRYKGAEAT